jgi:DNA-binding LacI/PurR family transcriptional regulator
MLPLQKSLRDSYRIGHGTVRTALSALAAEGLIERAGSRYRVTRPLRSSGGGRSVHIVGCGLEATSTRMDPWTLEIIAGVEHHVRDMGWEPPRYVTAERTGEGGNGLGAIDPGTVAGYIAVQHWATLPALRMTARAHQLPYVVVDPSDTYTAEASRTFTKDEPAFWLCTDNRAAGHAMGAHLRSRGHRRIAFISQLPPSRHRWIECRLAGLSDFFAEIDGGLSVFTRTWPRESRSREEGAMLPEVGRLRRFYQGRKGLPAAVTTRVISDLFYLNSMVSAGIEAEPLFAAALARKDITAWVCCNDALALIAREYLLHAGVGPGRDIALAGFDNTLHARASDVTSYDFALRELGYAAVQCLVRPQFFPTAARGVKRIPGGLVERGST